MHKIIKFYCLKRVKSIDQQNYYLFNSALISVYLPKLNCENFTIMSPRYYFIHKDQF